MCANALADFQFVDRYQELGFLTNAADDPAYRGVLVLGDPGIGKTSLVRVFALRRKESGQDTIFTSLREYPNAEELLLHLNHTIEVRSDLKELSPHLLQEVAPSPTQRRSYNRRLLSFLSVRLSKISNIHIVLDGLDEFMDPSRLVHYILNVISDTPVGVKFYITSRLIPETQQLDKSGLGILRLGPLSKRDIHQFIRMNLRRQDVSPATMDELATLIGGNPFLLNLLVRFSEYADPNMLVERPHDAIYNIITEFYHTTIARYSQDQAPLDQLLFILSGYEDAFVDNAFIENLLRPYSVSQLVSEGGEFFFRREERTGRSIGFSHLVFKDYFRERFWNSFQLYAHLLDFGAEEAERDRKLTSGLVLPAVLKDIANGTKSIVLGDRGSGKSALFRLLKESVCNGSARCSKESGAVVLSPSPDMSVFIQHYESKFEMRAVSTENFKEFWLLYFAENLARYSWRSVAQKAVEAPKILRRFLLRQAPDVLLAAAPTRVGRALVWLSEHLQGKVELSLFGIPLTFEASGKGVRRRSLDINKLIEALSEIFRATGTKIQVVLDRLDEIYKYDRESQKKFIQGLFLAEAFMATFDGIQIVILLRTDIYELSDIQEKNKLVGRSVRLSWDINSLYKMMIGRIASNEQLGLLSTILCGSSSTDDRGVRGKLRLLFPEQIDGTPITEYLEFYLMNARREIAPRQIVILLLALRDAVIRMPKRGSPLPVFEEHHVRQALDLISKLSYDEVLNDFRIGPTLLHNCRAGNIVEMSLEEARKLASAEDGDVNEQLTRLEKLGVLERVLGPEKDGKVEPHFNMPPLYTRCWPAPNV